MSFSRSEDNSGEPVLFFLHSMCSRDWTPVHRPGSKHFCPWSHLNGPKKSSWFLLGILFSI